MDLRRVAVGTLAYLVPTFAVAYAWHLVIFAPRYEALAMYRADVIVPFGFVAMFAQGVLASLAYGALFAGARPAAGALRFGVAAALLSWTFTTLSVAAKHPMTSVPAFMLLETAFTVAQYALVAPLIALAWRRP